MMTNAMSLRAFGVLAVAIFVAAVEPAGAQLETDLRFDFVAPGARSLALGGAFLGLADDATAAYTNPAGLSNLSVGGPEVAAEFRGWRYGNRFVERGSLAEGAPTGIGIDTVEGLDSDRAVATARGLSFLSVGYVLPRGWTTAIYRHELLNFRNEYLQQGIFFYPSAEELRDEVQPGDCDLRLEEVPCRFFSQHVDVAARVVNHGASVAYRFSRPLWKRLEDELSLGLGLSWSRFTVDRTLDLFAYSRILGQPELDRQPGGFFGPAELSGDRLIARGSAQGEDEDLGFQAGFLWKLGKEHRWRLGGVYRQGGRFRVDTEIIPGPSLAGQEQTSRQHLTFRVPDSMGVGVAYSAAQGRTKLAFDYDRVRYSQRLDDMIPAGDEKLRKVTRLADADELHLGLEQVFLVVPSLFVATARAGLWYETAHDPEIVSSDPSDRAFTVPAEDQLHWSAGLGLVVKEDFQIDVGADLSDPVKTVSLSFVKFF